MNLKQGLKITKSDNLFFFDFSKAKIKKITGRMFPILLGENDFTSIGYGILDRAGFLEWQGDIEAWYKLRGEIAESIIFDLLKAFHKHKNNVDITIKKFHQTQFKGYDMFDMSYKWGNPDFGGVPDSAISEPKEYKTVVEVKSKNEKNYSWIIEKGNIPEAEKKQALLMGYLSKMPTATLGYCFFTDEQEDIIKLATDQGKSAQEVITQNEWSYKNVKSRLKTFEIDMETLYTDLKRAKLNLDKHIGDGCIPRKFFNESEIAILEEYISDNFMDEIDETEYKSYSLDDVEF